MHFKDDDFEAETNKKCLNQGAVPSMFPERIIDDDEIVEGLCEIFGVEKESVMFDSIEPKKGEKRPADDDSPAACSKKILLADDVPEAVEKGFLSVKNVSSLQLRSVSKSTVKGKLQI